MTATPQSCVAIAFEESPRFEGAPTSTPYRVSTVQKFLPSQSVLMNPAPGFIDRSDELRGIDGGVAQLIDTFEPAGALSIRAYPNLLPFLLYVAGFSDTITAGDGTITDPDGGVIPVGAFRHVFTKRTGITAKSMQMLLAYVNEQMFFKGQGFGLASLALPAAGDVTGDLVGLVVGRTVDPNLSPSFEASSVQHFRRGNMTLSWLSGTGETSDFSLAFANELVRYHSYGLSTPTFFPDKLFHGDARLRATGTIAKAAFAAADYDAVVAGTPFAAVAKWTSTQHIGSTSTPFEMWVQMPSCQYIGMTPDALTSARRRGASFDFWAAVDDSAGFDVKVTVVCGISSANFEAYA